MNCPPRAHSARASATDDERTVSVRARCRVDQAAREAVMAKLNSRPRKRLGYRTPEECYAPA